MKHILIGFRGFVMCLAVLWFGLPAGLKAQAPDLTVGIVRFTVYTNSQYYIGGQFFTYNLGPTGLRGWIYALGPGTLDQFTSVAPWQILVTSVGTNTPANGILQTNDVILGVTAGLSPASLFTNDSRVALGNAITAAEADTGQLSFLVNRYGVATNMNLTIQLAISHLAYSATAPYNCPKSALLLSNALNVLSKMPMSRSVALALLASGDTNYLPQVQSYARGLAPSNLVLGWPSFQGVAGGQTCWDMGYNGTFLAEYYTMTNDPLVVNGLTQYIVMTAKSGTMFGCYGHGGAVVMPYHVAAGLHGYGVGYGPVNSCGLLCNLSVALGAQTGIPGIVTNTEVQAAITRANNFFSYYVQKGGVPYGEMPPYFDNYHMGARDGLAALFFGVQGNQPTQAQYFARMSLSSYHSRETGHTGAGWGLCWDPMGTVMGGTNAVAAYFSNLRWVYELNRRADGSFAYDCTGDQPSTAKNYWDSESYQGYLDPTAWNALFLAASRQALYITGKNIAPTNFISDAAVSNAVWAGQWALNAASYTTNQLLANLNEYMPNVRHAAAQQLAAMCLTNSALSSVLTPQLVALTTNASPGVRSAACDALATLNHPSALNALVACANDADVWVRFNASLALDNLGTAALPQLTNIMAAFVSNAVPDVFVGGINWNDPCGWGNGFLADLLFNKLAGSTIKVNTNLLYPAVRAGLHQPDRGCQGYLNSFLTTQLRWADVQALAGDLLTASVRPSQADEMWEGTEGAAPACLAKYGVEDGLAALAVMTDAGISPRIGREPTILSAAYHNYGVSATNLIPLLNNLEAVNSGALYSIMSSYVTTLQGNPTPPATTYFKQFTNVTANPSVVGLASGSNTLLSVRTSVLGGGLARYTWSVVQGPGPVTLSPNGSVTSSNCTARFSAPGTYVLQVMAVNDSVLNSNYFFNPSLPGGAYVSGSPTWNFNTWTNNYGGIYTNLSVTVWPASASLTNQAATGISSSTAILNTTLFGALTNAYNVWAYWGTANGNTNPATWSNAAYVGNWANVFATNLNWAVASLAANTKYYFNFRATNAAGVYWATNVLNFTTLSAKNAYLTSLVPSAGALTPAFASNTLSYTLNVRYANSNLTVTPTAWDLNASLQVNGQPNVSGSPSSLLNLSVGTNVITTVVVSADASVTNTYTLNVVRPAASPNAYLSSLAPSVGTLSPAFVSTTFSYSATVPNTTASITVTPLAVDSSANILVNGNGVDSGAASSPLGLAVGANVINTVVVSSDLTATNTYSLVVTRAALPVRWWDGGTTNLPGSGNGVAYGGSGTWDTTIQNWDQGSGLPYVGWNNANNDTAIFGGTPGTVTLGAPITVGGLDFDTSGYTLASNTLTFGGAGVITNFMSAGTTTISSTLAGSAPITLFGAGTLVLNGAANNPFNGGLVLGGGTLLVDFANRATPTNLISANNSLTLAGSSLSVKGKNSGTTSQTLNNVTVIAGGGQILGNKNGGGGTAINLGALTATNAGGSLLVGNATTTTAYAPVITTTSTNLDATGIYGGRVVFFNGASSSGYDWATTNSASAPYTFSAYTNYAPFAASGTSAGENYNLTTAITGVGTESVNTLKIVSANLAQTSGTTLTIGAGGLLCTGSGGPTLSDGTLTAGNGSGSYDLIVHQFASGGLTIKSVIGNNGGQAVNFVKAGTGGLMFGANNTYSGNTYVNAGLLHFGTTSLSGVGGGSGRNIYVAAGAGVMMVTPNNAFLNRIVQTSDEITIGTGTDGGAGVVDFSGQYGGTYFPNAYLGNWWGNGAKAVFSGTLIPADDTYRLGSPISAGVLGMLTTLTAAANPRSLIVAGVVDLVAANTFSGDTFLRPTARLFLGNPLALQNSPLTVGTGAAGDPNTGYFSLSDGTGNLNQNGDVAVPNPTLGGLKGSRNLLSVYSSAGYNGLGNVIALAPGAVTGFTLNVGANQTCVYSGVLGEFAPGTTLDLVGWGTQILTGANTYTGNTTIDNGTLLLCNPSGSGTGSGSVIVTRGTAGGGTLGGTGTISGGVNVNLGATISPGGTPAATDGVGTLTTGSETWSGDATAVFEVSSATNGAGRDLLVINGSLNVMATSGNVFTIQLVSMAGTNTPGLVPDFNAGSNYTWTVATASGGILNFDPSKFVVDASKFVNAYSGTFSVAAQGNSLVLNYTAPVVLVPPTLSVAGPVTGTSFALTFNGPGGQSYEVLSSTNLTLPLASWTTQSSGVFGGGPVIYTNASATNAQQFYLIQSP